MLTLLGCHGNCSKWINSEKFWLEQRSSEFLLRLGEFVFVLMVIRIFLIKCFLTEMQKNPPSSKQKFHISLRKTDKLACGLSLSRSVRRCVHVCADIRRGCYFCPFLAGWVSVPFAALTNTSAYMRPGSLHDSWQKQGSHGISACQADYEGGLLRTSTALKFRWILQKLETGRLSQVCTFQQKLKKSVSERFCPDDSASLAPSLLKSLSL